MLNLIWGCKPSVPSGIIGERDMEDILYEYHLNEAMAQQTSGQYESNIIAYQTALFRKHGVSRAEFDSSMVYYMRHTDRLYEMYKRIADRLEGRARELGSSEGVLAGLSRFSATGDTADVWRGDRTIALVPNKPYNVYSFSYVADSTYRKGDAFILTVQSDFIFQDGTRDGIATLAVVFDNDSVASRIVHMSSSTSQEISVKNEDKLGVKQVKGFFMLNRGSQDNASASALHLMVLSNIHLLKCRTSDKTTASPQDEHKIKLDSVPIDSNNMYMSKPQGGT